MAALTPLGLPVQAKEQHKISGMVKFDQHFRPCKKLQCPELICAFALHTCMYTVIFPN